MKRYNTINNILGWLCFAIAAATYLLTVEPTASFWDCPEFIVQGTKLEVGHPPGNPIFMLTARFFVTLFGSGMETAALAVNCLSALLSAATILLLFWSITHLASKLICPDEASKADTFRVFLTMAAGVCGALAYTWSDTFWFSAVEGEVYAFSSFCTALVVWLMFKWENRAAHPDSDRYLVLIAYIIGVSIAVHLLNLLCIPALGLIYYFRRSKNVDLKGSLIALCVSVVIVAAILYGLVPGFVQVAQWFEQAFVNGFGLSYNMGVLIYAAVLVAVLVGALWSIYRPSNPVLMRLLVLAAILLSGMPFFGHSVAVGVLVMIALTVVAFVVKLSRRFLAVFMLSVLVIFVGYSSYALLLIRASANTPMNQNAPDNVFALASYLNREQYGDRPLFYGPVFAQTYEEMEVPRGSGNYYMPFDENGYPVLKTVDGYLRDEFNSPFNTPDSIYSKVYKSSPSEPDRYVRRTARPVYKTMDDLSMLFTRMYSADHIDGYKAWSGYRIDDFDNIPSTMRQQLANHSVPVGEVLRYFPSMETVTTNVDSFGKPVMTQQVWKPGFADNLSYFINYQLNHMYWRYFMWNFAGRQNDIQGNGEPQFGNWISGIPFIDNARLGDQSLLPDEYGKANKGHNVFYMLPLLLGIIGLLAQALYRRWARPGVGIEQFWVVFFLFFMTGIAIVLYLNQTPGQPRERDYAYAGSFYAFAMWIGLAIPAIGLWIADAIKGKAGRYTAMAVCACFALGVPLQMVSQTWDDHDRSGRYTTRDFGFNYLASVDPDGIIFTNGDNDTFPLWYAQEVEGYRTDVRVVNLSYLSTDWYANQMTNPTYEAAPLPLTATPEAWAYEKLAYNFIVDLYPQNPAIDARLALDSLYSFDASRYGARLLTNPRVFIPVDAKAASERYSTGYDYIDSAFITPYISTPQINLGGSSGINQSKVLSLDAIANSMADGQKRPVYFASTVPTSYYLGLSPYMSATGVAYEVTPFDSNAPYNVTAQKAFRNIVGSYRWGGLDGENAENLYLDETVRRMVASFRSALLTVADNLLMNPSMEPDAQTVEFYRSRGLQPPATQADMARILLGTIRENLPSKISPYDNMLGLYMAQDYLDLYYISGSRLDLEAAAQLARHEAERYAQFVRYGASLDPYNFANLGRLDTYSMSYLGLAVTLYNAAEMLLKHPEWRNDPEMDAVVDMLTHVDLTDAWNISPLIYINGYDASALASAASHYSREEAGTIWRAIDLLKAHEQAGIEPMQFSNEIMQQYGFTASDWDRVHGR